MVYNATKICKANQDIQTIASSPHLLLLVNVDRWIWVGRGTGRASMDYGRNGSFLDEWKDLALGEFHSEPQ